MWTAGPSRRSDPVTAAVGPQSVKYTAPDTRGITARPPVVRRTRRAARFATTALGNIDGDIAGADVVVDRFGAAYSRFYTLTTDRK